MMQIHSNRHVLFTECFSPNMRRACPVLDTVGDTGEKQWAVAVLPHGVHRMVRRQMKGMKILH